MLEKYTLVPKPQVRRKAKVEPKIKQCRAKNEQKMETPNLPISNKGSSKTLRAICKSPHRKKTHTTTGIILKFGNKLVADFDGAALMTVAAAVMAVAAVKNGRVSRQTFTQRRNALRLTTSRVRDAWQHTTEPVSVVLHAGNCIPCGKRYKRNQRRSATTRPNDDLNCGRPKQTRRGLSETRRATELKLSSWRSTKKLKVKFIDKISTQSSMIFKGLRYIYHWVFSSIRRLQISTKLRSRCPKLRTTNRPNIRA